MGEIGMPFSYAGNSAHPLRRDVAPDREQAAQLAVLESFRGLAPGWDSYQAQPPSDAAIGNARRVLDMLWENETGESIRLSPSVEGGVSIVFKSPDKRYADIECFNDGEILAITSEPGSEPVVWPVDLATGELRDTLRRISTFLNG